MIWLGFCVGIYSLCLWLITIFVVRLSSGYTDAGNLALAMNITYPFYCIALYNIRTFQVSDAKGEYTDSAYYTARVLTCLVSIALCAVFAVAGNHSLYQISVILIYMLFRATEAIMDVLHGIDQKSWKMDYVGISFMLRGILILAAFVLLMYFYGLLFAVIGMFLVTLLVYLLFDHAKTRKLSKFTFAIDKSVWNLLKACFPLMLILLTNTLITTYSRYAIERICGVEALGVYVSLTAPTLVVSMALALIFTVFINVFTAHFKDKNKKEFMKVFLVCVFLVFFFTFIAFAISHIQGEWILSLLFGNTINEYAYLLPGAVIGTGLMALMSFFSVIFVVLRDIKGLLIGCFAGLTVSLSLSGFLLSSYDLSGANLILIISQSAACVYLFIRFFAKYASAFAVAERVS